MNAEYHLLIMKWIWRRVTNEKVRNQNNNEQNAHYCIFELMLGQKIKMDGLLDAMFECRSMKLGKEMFIYY